MSVSKKRLVDLLPKHRMAIDPTNRVMPHPTYDLKDIQHIAVTHKKPEGFRDWLAQKSVRTLRKSFDLVTGYNDNRMESHKWINRCIFLETVAGVPGMVGGMTMHLKSLTTLKPENGTIHHLLEEAENERTHLFIFLNFRNPGLFFRMSVALA